MTLINKQFTSTLLAILLTGCGGGSSSDSNTPIPTPPTTPVKATISISTLANIAVEKSNTFAKFQIQKTGNVNAINIAFQLAGNNDMTKGSASSSDYQLVYSDGGLVGNTLNFNAEQNLRVIEVQPVRDNLHEVPEVLTLTLSSNADYLLSTQNSAQITIIDADNNRENAKVFLGVFGPQHNTATSASGVLSFILQGDNEQGILNYTFSNLTSAQTDQHIHIEPSSTVIKDIETMGNISNLLWDLAPGGFFVNEQQMLDALFNGEFFVNIHTANYAHGEITANLNFDENTLPPEETELSPEDIDRDIIRFLTQATFGATPDSYQALRSKIDADGSNRMLIYDAWLEEQFSLNQTRLLTLTDEILPFFPEENTWQVRRDAFWPIALSAKDQLRQRMAFALSEILVIGDNVVTIRNAHRGTAHYWDKLAENAFGTYQSTLYDASVHPIMGFWLSHLKNKKANTELGYFPDENFAREIMQLFSFGLIQREKNGAIKLGQDNLPIPTYNNKVISEMAKVFTGLSYSYKNSDATKVVNNNFDLGSYTNDFQYRWIEPLKFFPEHHEFSEKTLFTDNGETLVIAENNNTNEANANTELKTVIDALVAHSSTAPFISNKLIQRFVTSNPSPDYIERVATAFGDTGDLKATIKAILLDKEARNPNVARSQTFGKMKEPLLQLSSIMRLFNARSQIPLDNKTNGLNLSADLVSHFEPNVSLLRIGDEDIGQRALGSYSVFNFFLPDFTPTGEIAKNSLVAPEMQLLTETQLFTTFNIYNKLLYNGFRRSRVEEYTSYTKEQLSVWLQKAEFNNLWQTTTGSNIEKATAIVDNLDFYLNAGQLKQTQNTNTRSILIETLANANNTQRFELAVYGVVTFPELAIQR